MSVHQDIFKQLNNSTATVKQYLKKLEAKFANDIDIFKSSLEFGFRNLIKTAISLAEDGVIESTLLVTLIEDLVDLSPVKELDSVISLLESLQDFFDRDQFLTKTKGLVMLRLCNELQRRLPKHTHARECGRISLFLSKNLTLCDRSGVNMTGNFNISNITKYDEESDDLAYKTFWHMQFLYSNPTLCFQALNLQLLKKGLEETFKLFEQNPIDNTLTDEQFVFQTKHITSKKTFDRLLRYQKFRREILIQIIIVLNYLLSKPRDVNSKGSTVSTPVVASKQPLKVLNESQEALLNDFRKQALRALEKTTPNGRALYVTARRMIKSEQHWADWKAEGCQSFEKPKASLNFVDKRKIKSYNIDDIYNEQNFGTEELSRLWKNESNFNNYEYLKNNTKLPRFEDYLEDLKEQMNPEDDIEKEYRLSNNTDVSMLQKIEHMNIEKLVLLLNPDLKEQLDNVGMDISNDNHNINSDLDEHASITMPPDLHESEENFENEYLVDESADQTSDKQNEVILSNGSQSATLATPMDVSMSEKPSVEDGELSDQ
ncbi:hypothetical protein ROZALSC1DRAFT_28066 [Rozella allomycis CSF55]|uniref:THO complex, subunit THOC1 domain-containing protein n=1 Tax=Rozella allomycis (strain CSF55) TaxID=988480 RepID=A0A4P9YLR2_ROZAC|nr:hypothetical protein ROZALSC1DRAFT_28066 [Rozella allomycis CSF55]